MSSDDFAVSVRALGKCYQIYERPADRLKQFIVPRLPGQDRSVAKRYYREFWALQDVSFDIRRGETVGIVGHNGSGKSTLLQMICGTLTPTTGSVETKGRIAALLELGSGFNPEFSGRDNVYLNAAVLGLDRDEIDSRYDRIAAFADLGDHLDQPVKTYSSGMFLRLAFAVIAHVDADVLIVDEALAVGDAVFNQKCMRFIRSFQERGTLLFVSHDASAVQNLCRTALWLDHGRLVGQGEARDISEQYLRHSIEAAMDGDVRLNAFGRPRDGAPDETPARIEVGAARGRDVVPGDAGPSASGVEMTVRDNLAESPGFGAGGARIVLASLRNRDDPDRLILEGGERVRLLIRARAIQPMRSPILGFNLVDRLGQVLFGENTLPFVVDGACPVAPGEEVEAAFDFTLPYLPNGRYSVTVAIADGSLYDHVQHHFLHDGLMIQVASSRVRWGLVGIPFESVRMERVAASEAP